ncbi:hypothetical protein AB0N62_39225 [Streptomyces sp. NPDC093982]|uniref:hypothetical protein n=1 Tax=Streptomyces sp. NPDC093982 TaxID=3155077 RepID=UPI003447C0AB
MKNLLVISAALVSTLGVVSIAPALANADDSESKHAAAGSRPGDIAGRWEGTDPLDGGQATRTFTRNDDGKISLIGGDTHITLCGGGDDGTYSFSDGVVRGHKMASDNFIVQCLPQPGASVRLLARYKMISSDQMVETLTRADTNVEVTEVILTKMSR